MGGASPSLNQGPCLSTKYCLYRFYLPFVGFSANVIPVGSWNLLDPLHLGLSSGYSQFPILHCYIPLFKFLRLCSSPSLLLHLISLPLPHEIIFHPLLSRTEASALWSSFFGLYSVSCIIGISSFLAKIHLSVSTYHVCSFGTGLPLKRSH